MTDRVINFLDAGRVHRLEYVFDLTFRTEQRKHYPGVRWYAGYREPPEPNRRESDEAREWLAFTSTPRTGRTTLLGLCFLEAAVTYPGKLIQVFDHVADRQSVDRMFETLRQLVHRHPVFQERVEFLRSKSSIMFYNLVLEKIVLNY